MRQKRILLVDDDKAVAELLKEALSEEGYNVTKFNKAAKALDILKLHSFDLILTDVIMPEINGVEFVEQLISEDIKTPIMMMSGNLLGHHDKIKAFLDKGIVKCLINKPFSLINVFAKVKEHAL